MELKADVTISDHEIVIEHRYTSFAADGAFASEETTLLDGFFAGLNVILDNKNTITFNFVDKTLTIGEKGRFGKGKQRFFNLMQLNKIIVFVHTQKKLLGRNQKKATVQVLSKASSDDPVLLFRNEPYHETIDAVSRVSESFGLPVDERDVLNKG